MNADARFHVVNQLLRAGGNAERARIVLRLSDQLVLAQSMAISEACQACGFFEGACFIALRGALLCATRDEHGLLPAQPAAELEGLRNRLSHLAAGM